MFYIVKKLGFAGKVVQLEGVADALSVISYCSSLRRSEMIHWSVLGECFWLLIKIILVDFRCGHSFRFVLFGFKMMHTSGILWRELCDYVTVNQVKLIVILFLIFQNKYRSQRRARIKKKNLFELDWRKLLPSTRRGIKYFVWGMKWKMCRRLLK